MIKGLVMGNKKTKTKKVIGIISIVVVASILGTVVYVFGIEVFNNAHVDYEHPSPLTRSPEVQEIESKVDEVLTSMGL